MASRAASSRPASALCEEQGWRLMLEQPVAARIYCADFAEFPRSTRAREECFDAVAPPARTSVGVRRCRWRRGSRWNSGSSSADGGPGGRPADGTRRDPRRPSWFPHPPHLCGENSGAVTSFALAGRLGALRWALPSAPAADLEALKPDVVLLATAALDHSLSATTSWRSIAVGRRSDPIFPTHQGALLLLLPLRRWIVDVSRSPEGSEWPQSPALGHGMDTIWIQGMDSGMEMEWREWNGMEWKQWNGRNGMEGGTVDGTQWREQFIEEVRRGSPAPSPGCSRPWAVRDPPAGSTATASRDRHRQSR